MNKLYFALAFAFVLTLPPTIRTIPAGLSCNEHGGCSASEAP